MNRRINVMLPERTLAALDEVAAKGNRSRLINLALLRYIRETRKQTLREELKAGYLANAERDLEMSAEWAPLEEEAWELMETGRTKRSRRKRS